MSENNKSNRRFDPFRVFKVDQKPCYQLTVHVLRGRNIEEAAQNFVDTPDPYVRVSLLSTVSPNVQFSVKSNTQDDADNPEWNQIFRFFVDLQRTNILDIKVFDEDVGDDTIIGSTTFNVNNLEENKLTAKTFTLNTEGKLGPAEIDTEFLLEKDLEPDLRFGINLCDEERDFLENRQQHVFESLKNVLGYKAPDKISDVPGIAMAHSGGGFRAMVATCGVMSGLYEAGLLDVITYSAGLSGSTWYMSHLYAQPDWPQRSPRALSNELKAEVTTSFTKRLLAPDIMYENIKALKKKKKLGQSISFTDFFGFVLGRVLQPKKLDVKLTDQAALVKTGKVPMPILTACTVKNDVRSDKFYEWVECTAFEVAMAKYGIAMKTEHFGSIFFLGRLVKTYPEPPLHFLQGIWGSAWAITLQGLRNVLEDFKLCICCKDKSEKDDIKLANAKEAKVLMAKKLKADLKSRDDNLRTNEEVVTLDKSDDTDDSDDEDEPAWYQLIYSSAEEKSLKKKKKVVRTKKVKPEKAEIIEEEEDEEEAEPMTLLDEIIEHLKKDGSILTKRTGRAAMVFNYLRGLELKKAYPVSPFMQFSSKMEVKKPFPFLNMAMDSEQESICIVDGGFGFEIPFPPLLRPQREVDIILSFDYSLRTKDYAPVFKQLKLAAAWARANQVPFPEIDETVYDREGMKEVYVFENLDDTLCPTVLHFPIINMSFTDFKKPGVLRETEEEKEFGDFDVYGDGEYHTLNFTYDERDFDRLMSLMEYNVLNNAHVIKEAIRTKVARKQAHRSALGAIYQVAFNNMANEDVFQPGIEELFGPDLPQKDPSSKQPVVEKFMTLVDRDLHRKASNHP